eukprot:TRINITY_DN400_c0_g1_i9.p1 TRINITY_DN400_c0_g1~~TRINITY_DN400_c0_g1_i9.p1  ORF type:complete len:360 (+),score=106.69 TRINITY_DN400_c0_g1_i9:58-1137(+)
MLHRALVRGGVCRAACGLQRRWASAAQLDRRVENAGRAARIAKRKFRVAVAAQNKHLARAKQQQARHKTSLAKQRTAKRARDARAKARAVVARKQAALARGAVVTASKAWNCARAALAAARKGVGSSKSSVARRAAISKLKAEKKRAALAARKLKKAKIAAHRQKESKVAAKKKTPNGKKVNKPATGLKLKQRTAAARKVAKTTAAALVQAKKARAEGLKQLKARAKTPLCGAARKVSKKKERRQLRKQSGPTSAYVLFAREAMRGRKPGSGAAQAAAAKWHGMPDAAKQPYVRQAAQNRAKYDELKLAAKGSKPMTKYQAFFKQHFRGAYDDAKRSGADRMEAFQMAARAVNAKWKQQ